jgi:hypothetical protein
LNADFPDHFLDDYYYGYGDCYDCYYFGDNCDCCYYGYGDNCVDTSEPSSPDYAYGFTLDQQATVTIDMSGTEDDYGYDTSAATA